MSKLRRLAFIFLLGALPFAKLASTAEVATQKSQLKNFPAHPRTIHISSQMRTLPNDNFSLIWPKGEFVPIELWWEQQGANAIRWKVKKPRRVLVMDGKSTTMLINHTLATQRNHASPMGCFDSWMTQFLTPRKLYRELKAYVKEHPTAENTIKAQTVSGRVKETIHVLRPASYQDSKLSGQFIATSELQGTYRFDQASGLLEYAQIDYPLKDGTSITIFKTTDIRYDTILPDDLFTITIPKDAATAYLPTSERTKQRLQKEMSPEQATEKIFSALSRKDWDEYQKFNLMNKVNPNLKRIFGGLKVITIGKAEFSASTRTWFVPYEIALYDAQSKQYHPPRKHKLALKKFRQDGDYFVDGGL
jgi:outer membrane lipoprotein-sorting protein